MKTVITAVVVLSLAACATNPDKISSIYVSVYEYQDKSCELLREDYAKNNRDAEILYKDMKSRNRKTKAGAWVGGLLFWPALFLMKGKNHEDDARLAELKGRKKAIEAAMSDQRC